VNPERIEVAASAFAGRAAINADGAADAADVERGGRVESAALAPAVRTAVAAGVRVVGVVMEPRRTDPAALAVAGRVAVNAPIVRPRLEETDSLGRGIHGRSDAIIAMIYRIAIRFLGQKRA
jgi:hypothetical protein